MKISKEQLAEVVVKVCNIYSEDDACIKLETVLGDFETKNYPSGELSDDVICIDVYNYLRFYGFVDEYRKEDVIYSVKVALMQLNNELELMQSNNELAESEIEYLYTKASLSLESLKRNTYYVVEIVTELNQVYNVKAKDIADRLSVNKSSVSKMIASGKIYHRALLECVDGNICDVSYADIYANRIALVDYMDKVKEECEPLYYDDLMKIINGEVVEEVEEVVEEVEEVVEEVVEEKITVQVYKENVEYIISCLTDTDNVIIKDLIKQLKGGEK